MYKMFIILTVFQFLDAFPSSSTLKDSKQANEIPKTNKKPQHTFQKKAENLLPEL